MKRPSSAAAILAAFFVAAACKNNPVLPYDRSNPRMVLTQTIETARVIVHYSPGDIVETARVEAYCEWAEAFMNVTLPKKIDYFKFKDREQLYRVTGSLGTGWADPIKTEVWTYMPWLNHECMHLYSLRLGDPPILFSEGTAEAYQVDPLNIDFESRDLIGGEKTHDIARRYKAQGRLVPLDNILVWPDWYHFDYTTTYVEAGSFVRFLADTQGIEKVKEVFRLIGERESREVILQKFLDIYGFTLQEAETAWLAFLDGG